MHALFRPPLTLARSYTDCLIERLSDLAVLLILSTSLRRRGGVKSAVPHKCRNIMYKLV